MKSILHIFNIKLNIYGFSPVIEGIFVGLMRGSAASNWDVHAIH